MTEVRYESILKLQDELRAERERSQKLIARLRETNECIIDDDDRLTISRRLNEKAISEYESQSK